jgi:hypothetical protein
MAAVTSGDVLTFAPWVLFVAGLGVLWLRLRRSGRGGRRADPPVRVPAPRQDPAAGAAARREAPEPPQAADDASASERAD